MKVEKVLLINCTLDKHSRAIHFVAFVGLVEVKNRLTKRKNKREDADQEKSGTE